jgi:hypothetical protein
MIARSALLIFGLSIAGPAFAADNCLSDMAHMIALDARLTVQGEAVCTQHPNRDQGANRDQGGCMNGDGDALVARIRQKLADVAAARCEAGIIR